MNANTLRRLNWLWKHRHTHVGETIDGSTPQQHIQIIRTIVEEQADDIAAGRGGAPDVIIAPVDGVHHDTADIVLTGVDDHLRIQEASDDGAYWVHIQAGTVHWGGQVAPNHDLRLTGAGMNQTRILGVGDYDQMFHLGTTGNVGRQLDISYLEFDGDDHVGRAVGFVQAGEGRLHANNVHFRRFAVAGINYNRPAAHQWVHNCRFSEMVGEYGITGRLEVSGIISNSRFIGCGIFASMRTIIQGNRIDGDVETSGLIDPAQGVLLIGNIIGGRVRLTNVGSGGNFAIGNRIAQTLEIAGWSAHNIIDGEMEEGGHTFPEPPPQGRINTFFHTGELAILAGVFRLVWPFDVEIISVRATVGGPPVGSDMIVDVNRNGPNTIFTTQANRPRVVDGETIGGLATPNTTAFAEGDVMTIDIDQVGSTDPGSDLSVIVEWEAT